MEYSSLDVRFKSEIRLRSFSPCLRIWDACSRAEAGRVWSASNCPAKPKITERGVRTSWEMPLIQSARALSFLAIKAPALLSCRLISANSPLSGRLTDWPEETVSIPRKMGVTAFSTCRVFFQISRTTTMILVRKTAASPTSSFLA